jgi:DNA topoisomerase-6 subunit B
MVEEDKIFKQFKEHSVAEFFKKNQQMLGFSGKVRSLTTVVHEFVTNAIDAAEEAGILPEIMVQLEEMGSDHFRLTIKDNGPGIPKTHVGKALGQMLAGTKFHRYVQQRGQQGIGASGCVMFSYMSTGQPTKAISHYKGRKYEIDVLMDFKRNRPILNSVSEEATEEHGLTVISEFKGVKHEKSNKGMFEYLRRTALANPHVTITFTDPAGERNTFPRSIEQIPPKPKEIKPHPLGIGAHDLLEFANHSTYSRISSFLQNDFTRVSAAKVNELRAIVPEVDFNKKPSKLSWDEAEKIVKAFDDVRWIAPATDSLVPIGAEQIEASFNNIFSPDLLMVSGRSPRVYKGGIPFMVEVGIAFGGGVKSAGKTGEIMRFANKVPLLFDTSGCAITNTIKSIDWKRYNLKNFDDEPIVVLVNMISVHVPYTGAGKQAIADEEEIESEIKFAVMEAARGIQKYLAGKRKANEIATKKKVVSRYVEQIAADLADLTGRSKDRIKKELVEMIEKKYERAGSKEEEEEKPSEQTKLENGNGEPDTEGGEEE